MLSSVWHPFRVLTHGLAGFLLQAHFAIATPTPLPQNEAWTSLNFPRDEWAEEYRSIYDRVSAREISPFEFMRIIATELPHVAMIGDSLAFDFHFESKFDATWKIWFNSGRNCFLDCEDGPSKNGLDSFCERVCRDVPIYARNYSVPGASIAVDLTWTERRVGVKNLREQVDQVLEFHRFPDLVLIWIGHNDTNQFNFVPDDVDFESYSSEAKTRLMQRIKTEVKTEFREQLARLLKQAAAHLESDPVRRIGIVVYGLPNYESYYKATLQAEEQHHHDKKRFPSLPAAQDHAKSYRPENRPMMEELQRMIFRIQREVVADLREEYRLGRDGEPPPRLNFYFTNAINELDLSDVRGLNPVDGWHFSLFGRNLFADGLYQGALPAMKELGWTSASETDEAK